MNTVKPESIALFCLTPGGVALAKRLAAMLPLTCFTSEKLREEGFIPFDGGFANTARQAFTTYTALIFIGATGIAVRVLAPLVNDKFSDPAVVVIDERGQHVISLLSGHAGGANALTRYLAGMLGADPVITTATDVNEMSALDTLAFQLNARMSDLRTAVKTVNQMLVSHQRVGLWWDAELTEEIGQCDIRGFIPVDDLQRLPELDALICVSLRNDLPELPVPHWKLVPQRVVAGIGCRRDTPFPLLATLLARQLEAQKLDPLALKAIGSVTLKKGSRGLFSSPPAAACLLKPLPPKRCVNSNTIFRFWLRQKNGGRWQRIRPGSVVIKPGTIVRRDPARTGRHYYFRSCTLMLSVIGIGPGSQAMMTMEAIEALQAAEIVVGYKTYTHLVKAFTGDKQVIKTGMCKEIERCQAAIELAQAGHNVALISSGDAGIYGMAGLVLELVGKQKLDVEVRLIPGMTASIAAASLLGAPLMHDFCHISLSDLLTPWPVIEKRIVAAGEADFVICFYNPRSRGREGHLARAFDLLAASKSAQTPVGVVKSAGRKKEEKWLTTLGDMDFEPVDMTSLVIVGNKTTYVQDGLMITPRGYVL